MQKIVQKFQPKSPVCVGNSFALMIHRNYRTESIFFFINRCRDLQAIINLIIHKTDECPYFFVAFSSENESYIVARTLSLRIMIWNMRACALVHACMDPHLSARKMEVMKWLACSGRN